MEEVFRLSIPLISHIEKTNRKYKNDFLKIGGQAIYNGFINKFTRAIVMNNLHDYIANNIPLDLKSKKLKIDYGIVIKFNFKTVINREGIRMINEKISYKPPVKMHKPSWDMDNLSSIWIKAINDTLVKQEIFSRDSVDVIRGSFYEFIEVKTLDESEIEIIIMKK